MSLSTFFRDYVYIPLGGNRNKQLRNMFVVWLLTGLWHGASWNFVLWGLYYFLMLAFEKYVLKDVMEKIPKVIRFIYSIFVVIIGWVFFYFEDMSSIGKTLGAMFSIGDVKKFAQADITTLTNNVFLIVICVLASTPLVTIIVKKLSSVLKKSIDGTIAVSVLTFAFHAFILFVCIACLVGSTYNPFLYFRF